MGRAKKHKSIFRPALLRSESPQEYAAHMDKISGEYDPNDCIEMRLVERIAKAMWEEMRFPDIINVAFMSALQNCSRSDFAFYGIGHRPYCSIILRESRDEEDCSPQAG